MATWAIEVPDAHRDSLKAMVARRGLRLSKLMEELLIRASVEHDAEMRCLLRASLGDLQRGLRLLAKLDRTHGTVFDARSGD